MKIGEIFEGRYKLLSVLGKGGLSTVYEAVQLDLGRTVALKVLHSQFSQDEEFKVRLLREGQALGWLSSATIVTIYHVGFSREGQLYLVMELIKGVSARHRLNELGRFATTRALKIVLDAARALALAHENGIVHRDLKPENLMLLDAPEIDTLKIIDFGLASIIDEKDQKLTITGAIIGTPSYMSPEQCKGLKIDARSDIYSLATCLYEFLVGAPCFDADSPISIMFKHVNEPAPVIAPKDVEQFSPLLNRLISRAMEKKPELRYQTMNEFADAIEAALRELEGQTVSCDNSSLGKVSAALARQAAIKTIFASRQFWIAFASLLIILCSLLLSVCLQKKSASVEYRTALTAHKNVALDEGKHLERLLRAKEEEYGSQSAAYAKANHDIAIEYLKIEKLEAAERCLRRAIDIWSKISGKESVQVAAELDYLGQVRLRQGRYVEAAALINHSISIRTKVLGLNCIECVWSMEELSTVLERQGKLEEAEKLMRKALSIREKHDGKEHYLIAGTLDHLGNVLLKEGKIKDAEQAFRGSLLIREKTLGLNHPDVADSLEKIAGCCGSEGRVLEAQELAERAKKIRR